jgi:DNA (cytosine-5)-methyltransferase 1
VVTLDVRDAERLQGFPPEWTQPAETVGRSSHRWKLVGNAVSVPAAKWLGGRLARLGEVLPFETATLRPGASWPTAAWCVDGTRLSVSATEFPVRLASTPLEQFLQYRPKPLSAKATSGFLKRASQAKLRFPEGFIEKLEHHLRLVEGEGSVESAVRGRRPATGQT